MSRFLILLIFTISGWHNVFANKAYSDSIFKSLDMLDHMLEKRNTYDTKTKTEIDKTLQDYQNSESLENQYNTLRNLFNLYRTYKVDSALITADQRLAVAQKIGEQAKIISASLNIADAYAKLGSTDKAISILDTLVDLNLAPHQIKYLNSIYKTAYINKANTALLPHDKMEALEFLKKSRSQELKEIDEESRGYYLLRAERLRDAGLYQEAVAVLEEMERKFDINDNAAILYQIGENYLAAEMTQQAILKLTKASILDLSNGSKEYKALILLAQVLFNEGDVDRSFAYINCAFEDALFSNAHIRTDEIINIMPEIYRQYALKEKEIKRRTAWFLSAIGFLNILLFVLVVLLIKEHRIKKKMINEINEFNSKLETQNKKLKESDKMKMEYLKRFMLAYASHISRLKSFRKNIHQLINSGQYSKALEKIKIEKEDSPDSSVFQEMFDAAFLSMFPDFISQINNYLKEPIENLSNGLTPELRIAALMKLGITSTREISEMFQYSPQSVYNLRSTLKGNLKISLEEFETEVISSY